MTKSEYCTQHDPIAYYSGLNGIEIRGIEYGIEDYIYCISGMICGKQSFHRCKVQYTKTRNPFIKLFGKRISLCECLKVNV